MAASANASSTGLRCLLLTNALGDRAVPPPLLPADPKLLGLVREQLELGPIDRLKLPLGDDWPACRHALGAAAFVGELAVRVGPVAYKISLIRVRITFVLSPL